MDGPHDLGGRQFFGAVIADEPEEPFHSDWEARMWSISRSIRQPPDWNIDWWRHVRELIDPVDYLTRPYFDQWMQIYAALLVDSGIATVDEIATGKSVTKGPDLPAPLGPDKVRAAAAHKVRFDREVATVPAFKPGDRVRTNADGVPTHTRLPAYVRGRIGRIERLCSAHVLPDAKSHGQERAEPLYTVRFEAADLWPEARDRDAKERRACVHLDLWESYLERA
ncbi:MAG: nitrile hydratase subunit beta [Dongiaceae bacterium]